MLRRVSTYVCHLSLAFVDFLTDKRRLVLDLSLNILFIRMVKTRLVKHGLKKYDKVMRYVVLAFFMHGTKLNLGIRFNEYIIIVSIGMDVLLLGTTFLRNTFVYCQVSAS